MTPAEAEAFRTAARLAGVSVSQALRLLMRSWTRTDGSAQPLAAEDRPDA